MTLKIEKSIQLKATPARVWRALTDHEEFGAWFQVRLDGPFEIGTVTTGQITYPGYEHLRWSAVVERMDAEKLFAFSWHPGAEEPEEYSEDTPKTLVEFRLTPKDGGTFLEITESGFEKLPLAEREESMKRNDGGWTLQVENIRAHVEAG